MSPEITIDGPAGVAFIPHPPGQPLTMSGLTAANAVDLTPYLATQGDGQAVVALSHLTPGWPDSAETST